MTNEDVMNAFKEKGIEVTLYETPYHTVENVVIDTYEHDKQIRAEFAHELKETFNNETPSNYASTQPFFTLENVRALVDMTLKEQNNE